MKNLKYYLSLNYAIELLPLSEDDGGGYRACIPRLGRFAAVGDGETPEEALQNLEESKEYFIKYSLENDFDIPEPIDELEEAKAYSGKFVLRIPSNLHQKLAESAKKNKTTLNQYCTMLLAGNHSIDRVSGQISEMCDLLHTSVDAWDHITYPELGNEIEETGRVGKSYNKDITLQGVYPSAA